MLSLLLLAALSAPQAAGTVALAPDTEARWVPFEITPSNQLRFALDLDGHPARALLDTGVSHTVVARGFADAAGLRATGGQDATAIGGNVRVDWAATRSLAFGGLTRRGGRIGISDAVAQERFGADLLLGADVLACCALEIDYDARRFRILPSGRLPFAGTSVALGRTHKAGVFTSEVTIAGRTLKPMIVDTGDGSGLTVTQAGWKATGQGGAPVTTTLGWGLGGPVVTEMTIVPAASIGTAAPIEAEVRVEGVGGYSASVGAAGRIGNGVLMRYRVLLDPRAGRMVLQPRAAPERIAPSTSGLLLGRAGAAAGVVHVMRGSPAAESGWREGDRICAVDGASLAGRTNDPAAYGWTAGQPGRTVRLTLCDGEERSLTLRRFY